MHINEIYNIDCVQGMATLPPNSIDLTIISPPYDDCGIIMGIVSILRKQLSNYIE